MGHVSAAADCVSSVAATSGSSSLARTFFIQRNSSLENTIENNRKISEYHHGLFSLVAMK